MIQDLAETAMLGRTALLESAFRRYLAARGCFCETPEEIAAVADRFVLLTTPLDGNVYVRERPPGERVWNYWIHSVVPGIARPLHDLDAAPPLPPNLGLRGATLLGNFHITFTCE